MIYIIVPPEVMHPPRLHDSTYWRLHGTAYWRLHDSTYWRLHGTAYWRLHGTAYWRLHDSTYLRHHGTANLRHHFRVKMRLTGISFSHRFLVCLGFLDFPIYSSLIGQPPAGSNRRMLHGGRWLARFGCQKNIPGKFRGNTPSLKATGGRIRQFCQYSSKYSLFFSRQFYI